MKKWSGLELVVFSWLLICIVGLVFLDVWVILPSRKTGVEIVLENAVVWRKLVVLNKAEVSGKSPDDFYLISVNRKVTPEFVSIPEERRVEFVFREQPLAAGEYKVVGTRGQAVSLTFTSEIPITIICYNPVWAIVVVFVLVLIAGVLVFLLGFAILDKVFGNWLGFDEIYPFSKKKEDREQDVENK